MGTDAETPGDQASLFRRPAATAAGHRLFGSVVAVLPPSAGIAVLVSTVALSLLVTTTVIVEVPSRARGVGVLMPAGGFLNVVAVESGRVSAIHIEDNQEVIEGELLLEVSAIGTTVPGNTTPELKLRSLRTELALLDEAQQSRQLMTTERLQSLQQGIDAARERQDIGKAQLAAHRESLTVLESRFRRLGALAGDGHVSLDALDEKRAELIRARSTGSDLEQRQISLRMEIGRLESDVRQTKREADVRLVEHNLRLEQLNRELELTAYNETQGIRAPASGIIARLLTTPDSVVSRGQILAKLAYRTDSLEAWLYVSSSSARMLRAGQTVELQLDAWPQAIFGTRRAVVSSVSAIALEPADLAVPLNLPGPVFEIKATLDSDSLSAYGTEWPIPPGTSFSASIIQRRLRLYQWLARSLDASFGNGHA